MNVDIAAIRAGAEKATPGPWQPVRWDTRWLVKAPSQAVVATAHGNDEANGLYIAKLDPQTVLALCDLAEKWLRHEAEQEALLRGFSAETLTELQEHA